jgi:hypothetical protein
MQLPRTSACSVCTGLWMLRTPFLWGNCFLVPGTFAMRLHSSGKGRGLAGHRPTTSLLVHIAVDLLDRLQHTVSWSLGCTLHILRCHKQTSHLCTFRCELARILLAVDVVPGRRSVLRFERCI